MIFSGSRFQIMDFVLKGIQGNCIQASLPVSPVLCGKVRLPGGYGFFIGFEHCSHVANLVKETHAMLASLIFRTAIFRWCILNPNSVHF